jgi:3D (Asp-Asp-Asp) domain-containing protein
MQIRKIHKIVVLFTIIICVCCCFPVAAYAPSLMKEEIQEIEYQESLQKKKFELMKLAREKENEAVQEQQEWIDVRVTAYDLSIRSCGKRKTHKEYGISRSGISLRGHTRESAMAVAVDPEFISLGSKIQIEFYDSEYQKYNGIYTCVDTGSAVKKNRIDLFLGDFGSEKESKEVARFGITKAKITIIKNEKENF